LALIPRSRRPPSAAVEPATRDRPFKSLALKALLEALKPGVEYRTLDLGPAVGSNVEFLSQFSPKIRIEDLYKTFASNGFFERNGEPFDGSVIGRLLSIPRSERFDIILCWDLVNYFRPEELKELVRELGGFCASGSLLFAISSTLKEMPSAPTTYRILDTQTLLYIPGSEVMQPCPRYVPRDLVMIMSGFRIHSSFILQNGMQEYLFVRT
jgi:hypothetical protein